MTAWTGSPLWVVRPRRLGRPLGRSFLLRRLTLPVVAALALLALAVGGTASASTKTVYDTFQKKGGYSPSDYYAKWSNGPGGAYGLGDMGVAPGDTRSFADGTFYIDDGPFAHDSLGRPPLVDEGQGRHLRGALAPQASTLCSFYLRVR